MPPTSPNLSARLIFPTKEIVEEFYLPIIYTACRTCYSEQVPDQIWDKAVSRQVADEKQQNLVRKVMESGHGSTIEHVNFTFAISGVTRTLTHQLVRHRAGTAFDQQSQRYVSFKQRDNYTVPDSIAKGELPDELAETLAESGQCRIERIVSHGHASPAGFWYDQDQHEWVIVLKGAARLRDTKGARSSESSRRNCSRSFPERCPRRHAWRESA